MAATLTQRMAQLAAAIYPLEVIRLATEANGVSSTDWLDEVEDLAALLGTNTTIWSPRIAAGVQTAAGSLDALMREGGTILEPCLYSVAESIGWRDYEPQSILGALYDEMISTGDRIKSRDFTFGSVTFASAAVGDGTIHRLTVDENGLDIEACTPEVKTIKCIADQSTEGGNRHEEVFEVRGANPYPSALSITGTGLAGQIRGVSARDSLLGNPSFDEDSDVTSSGSISSWTSSITVNSSNFATTTNYYRDYFGAANNRGLTLKASVTLTQKLSVRGTKLNAGTPYYLQIAFDRATGSATGTLEIALGGTTKSVAVSAQTGWNVLRLDLGSGLWPINFNEDELDVAITWTRTGGDLDIDDVILVPMQPADGTWWLPAGGETLWQLDDKATATDSATEGAILQYWLWRVYGRYLPAGLTSAITFPDPS